MENYEVISEIGSGQFGKVMKIRRKQDGKILVWKQLEYGAMDEKEKSQLVAEVNILSEVRHPNIVRYYDRIIDKQSQHIFIIMEYCEGGDLAAFLKKLKRKKEMISETAIWQIFQQMIMALHEIHHKKIMHRDLKPANIFLDSKNNVKLGDFGLSKKLSDETKFAETNVGTPYYMSPEQIEEKHYNEKSDIWAVGCLLYELGALVPPFPASNYYALAIKIKTGKLDRLGKQYSNELMRVITWCLQKESENRPSVDDLLNLPQVSMILREKRLKENQITLKTREEEIHKKSELFIARDNALNTRENQIEKKEEELSNIIQSLEGKKAFLTNLLNEQISTKEKQNSQINGIDMNRQPKIQENQTQIKYGIQNQRAPSSQIYGRLTDLNQFEGQIPSPSSQNQVNSCTEGSNIQQNNQNIGKISQNIAKNQQNHLELNSNENQNLLIQINSVGQNESKEFSQQIEQNIPIQQVQGYPFACFSNANELKSKKLYY